MALFSLGFILAKLLDNGVDGVLAPRLDNFAPLELVGVDVADELSQRLEVVQARASLIVFASNFVEGCRQLKCS